MTTKEKVKALWQLCFDDNEEFVEMYFRLRYKNEINIAIESTFQEPALIRIFAETE